MAVASRSQSSNGRPSAVDRIDLLRLADADDVGRAALHDGDVDAAGAEILRHVVAAVAGAEDHAPCGPSSRRRWCSAPECITSPLKASRPGSVRPDRDAADAGGEDDVPRLHRALAAVAAPQRHRPAALALSSQRPPASSVPVQKLSSSALDIGLEPVGELVLGDEHRPGRRERHQRQVVDVHLVVQRERMVAQPPVVADALVAVDDQRVDAEMVEPRRDADRPAWPPPTISTVGSRSV